MKLRVRLLRLFRSRTKGPLFTVFFMFCALYTLSIVQTLLSSSWRPAQTGSEVLVNLSDLESLLTEAGAQPLEVGDDSQRQSSESDIEQTEPVMMDFGDTNSQEVGEESELGTDGRDLNENRTCTTHIMFLADSQVGNLMVKYSVLYALREKFNAQVYLFPKQARFLGKIFTALSIPPVPNVLKTADWRPVSYEDLLYMLPCNRFVSDQEYYTITDWPEDNGLPLFEVYLADLRREFKFLPTVRNKARRFTDKLRNTVNSTLVGIHVRRGDHHLHTWLRHHRKLPDLDYFNKSMQYFFTMFPDVRFVAASDDRRYLRQKLIPEAPFPIYTTGSSDQVSDMAFLSSCDHMVISVGTFGLFSGLLTGGTVVSAAPQLGTKGDPFDIQVNPPGHLSDIFLWN